MLELAEPLGNVAEARRHSGIDGTSFYDWKRRFQLDGLDGSRTCRPSPRVARMTTPPEVVERIEALARHPAYACDRLETPLALEGQRLSAITIQKILDDKGLGTRDEHCLCSSQRTPTQAAWLEELNPCFRKRHAESERPGRLLSADTSDKNGTTALRTPAGGGVSAARR